MTYFHACQGCSVAKSDCGTRVGLQTALIGLGVTSLRHKCAERTPLFEPGDAVMIETVAWLSKDSPGDDEPPKCWFPGIFVRQKGPSAIAFIKPGTMAEDGPDEAFETSGLGFVKVPLARVRTADGPKTPLEECRCGSMPGLTGRCNDPENYAGRGMCLHKRIG